MIPIETIIGAAIGGLVSLIVCIVNNRYQQNKTISLIEFKLENLGKRMDKHNQVIERTYQLEENVAVIQEKVKVANHRIDDLERKGNT